MIVMGRVRAPFGVRGWIKVQPYSGQPDRLLDYDEWWLKQGDAWVGHRVCEAAQHGPVLIALLDGVKDRNEAATLKGRDVAIPRSRLPEPKEGEHYWIDLIGLQVENRTGVHLGTVRRLLETGANNVVLVVEGERDTLIPFVEGVILKVGLPGGRIVADWEADY
jgi:16S rRNA processing protein RimM